jgi:shikimate kinase
MKRSVTSGAVLQHGNGVAECGDRKTRDEIVLIGPPGSGKSTIAMLLAARLGLPRICLDETRWRYFYEIGYDAALADKLLAQAGFAAVYRHWKPYEAHAVKRVLEEHARCVFDLGAGNSVFADELLFEEVRAAFAPFRHVVLLLPSRDPQEAIEILRRRRPVEASRGVDLYDHFVRHPSNLELSTHVITTGDRTAEQTCDEVLRATGVEPDGAPDAAGPQGTGGATPPGRGRA